MSTHDNRDAEFNEQDHLVEPRKRSAAQRFFTWLGCGGIVVLLIVLMLPAIDSPAGGATVSEREEMERRIQLIADAEAAELAGLADVTSK